MNESGFQFVVVKTKGPPRCCFDGILALKSRSFHLIQMTGISYI